jgi:hypothetical protein
MNTRNSSANRTTAPVNKRSTGLANIPARMLDSVTKKAAGIKLSVVVSKHDTHVSLGIPDGPKSKFWLSCIAGIWNIQEKKGIVVVVKKLASDGALQRIRKAMFLSPSVNP